MRLSWIVISTLSYVYFSIFINGRNLRVSSCIWSASFVMLAAASLTASSLYLQSAISASLPPSGQFKCSINRNFLAIFSYLSFIECTKTRLWIFWKISPNKGKAFHFGSLLHTKNYKPIWGIELLTIIMDNSNI